MCSLIYSNLERFLNVSVFKILCKHVKWSLQKEGFFYYFISFLIWARKWFIKHERCSHCVNLCRSSEKWSVVLLTRCFVDCLKSFEKRIKKYEKVIVKRILYRFKVGSGLCLPDDLCNQTRTEISRILFVRVTQKNLNQMYPSHTQEQITNMNECNTGLVRQGF